MKKIKTNNIKKDKDFASLPPFTVKTVITALSETIDWGLKQLNVPETWKTTQGEDIVVMVIDTGTPKHIDLEENLLLDKCTGFVEDEDMYDNRSGHSTHCSGIIAASQNGIGVVGVAPKCKIITVKALGDSGSGSKESIIKALKYAAQIKPDIVSMSLGMPVDDNDIHNCIKKLYDLNIVMICASGNDGRYDAVNYPAKYEECIAVTAFDSNGNPANFNSTGPQVDISAPGKNIYSTYLNNSYAQLSGTSMATPFISGVVALLLAKHRKQEAETGFNDCKTIEDVKLHLKKYSDDKGAVGNDNIWGYGMVNPTRLILDELSTDKPEITPKPKRKKSLWYKIKKLFRI